VPPLSTLQTYLAQTANSVAAHHEAPALVYRRLPQEASALSYLDGFRIMAALFIAAILFVWTMKKPHLKAPSSSSN
jgi:hypothetical protein